MRFRPYVADLRKLASTWPLSLDARTSIRAALDGQPLQRLRTLVKEEYLHETGTFFSGAQLAERLIHKIDFRSFPKIADPACGIGDLLLACARRLPLGKTFESTLKKWEKSLYGCDLHKEFVDATKLRLCLLLLSRGLRPAADVDPNRIFQNITVADGLIFVPPAAIDVVLMNPPYNWVPAPVGCDWSKGSVCAAGLFVERWLSLLKPAGTLIALLPDVLRAGTNYDAWRKRVLGMADVQDIGLVGRFGKDVDIDVFRLVLTIDNQRRMMGGNKDPWSWYLRAGHEKVIGDFFDVAAGSVVPHRDVRKGPSRPYIHAKNAKAWGTLKRISEQIVTSRRLFYPPFVLVRRTSSPSDKKRAVGTLVLGRRGVAVENHLLVLKPRRGRRKKCEELMRILKSSKTSEWLNRRIRCRHLTVGALSELPWQC